MKRPNTSILLTGLLISLISPVVVNGQVSKNIVPYINIHTPDSVVGNDSVPSVHYTTIEFKKTIVVRFKYQTDILEGLNEVMKREKIKNAVILTGIGSVYQYHVHSVSNFTFPSKNVFYKRTEPNDLLSLTGYILEGKVHVHISLSNGITSVGGHLEPETRVFTFCVVTIGILDDDSSLFRFDDKTWR